jgi:LacI family transcriptional regulator
MTTKPDKITIREVAARAGVSVMTVSRVLRNEPYVTEDKRSAVQAAIKALGYVPLQSARNLPSSIPRSVGLLVPSESADIESKTGAEYLTALHLGALNVCNECNLTLVMVKAQSGRNVAEELVSLVRRRQVGGYVIPAPATEIPGLMKALRQHEVPFSAISPLRLEQAPRWVAADERPAVRAITQHLIQLGHSRIAFAGGGNSRAGVERLAGFVEAMASAGLAVDNRLVGTTSGFGFEDGLQAGRVLLSGNKRPTAVICANDDIAAGVLAVAHEMQIPLPDALSVVGFDNSGLSRKTWPALTSINLPVAAMADRAVRQLASVLDAGAEPVAATALLPCEAKLRASVTKAPAQEAKSPRAARSASRGA